MTKCDVCGADATSLIVNDADRFRGYRCDPHGRDVLAAYAGQKVTVYPLVKREEPQPA